MNAMQLLSELLTQGSNKPSSNQPKATSKKMSVLERVIEKQHRERMASRNQPRATAPGPPQPRTPKPASRHGGATLDELLRDIFGRVQGQSVVSSPTPPREQPKPAPQSPPDNELNERAKVLIRAMVNAAKVDGKLDDNEQQNILKQLGQIDSEEAKFLQSEFKQPIDVQQFAREVPRGMEEEVYAISLMAIDLDNKQEVLYLSELGELLRMDPNRCNQIHEHYGEPSIYQ